MLDFSLVIKKRSVPTPPRWVGTHWAKTAWTTSGWSISAEHWPVRYAPVCSRANCGLAHRLRTHRTAAGGCRTPIPADGGRSLWNDPVQHDRGRRFGIGGGAPIVNCLVQAGNQADLAIGSVQKQRTEVWKQRSAVKLRPEGKYGNGRKAMRRWDRIVRGRSRWSFLRSVIVKTPIISKG